MRRTHYPMGRIATAWDATHAAALLVSDEVRCITGPELVVDGGLTL